MESTVALFDNAALRRLEAVAAEALGDRFVLMQRAGEAAWRQLLSRWPQAVRIVVVCGTGNNGGDGYMLAVHALGAGRHVAVLRSRAPATDLARRACDEFVAAGGDCTQSLEVLPGADLVVDGLFGIGLSRAPDPVSERLIEAINASPAGVLALDVPSGVDADSGCVPGAAVRAQATLQMLGAHVGLVTGAAIDYCGTLLVDPLGLTVDDSMASARALDAAALHEWLQPRLRDSHKGNNGHVLCIGGDHGSGGAIALCAEAALRSGAGLVSVATRADHVVALLARRPEIMASGISDTNTLAPLCSRADCIAVGPGLGTHPWGAALLNVALHCGKPLVLDADALNLLAAHPQTLPAETVLTPHPGEAARLLGCSSADIQRDRHAAAKALVDRFACVVVLKGAGTIVAAPGRIPFVITAGNPGMAVGGMGDLLTGVVAALRAQGMPPFDAAACGTLLHAVAGDDAAREAGERGLLPSDLLPHLRRRANPGAAQ
jgi:ADP-dependent NAD(P)H-hydrate dehydratase / NAD(P)H-hydrate epimerase